MSLDLFAAEPGSRTVSRHGAPAECVPYGGMPAYESETGALAVMECVLVFHGKGGSPSAPLVLPASYGMVCLRGRGLIALHDDPDAVWSWRPLLYSLHISHTQGFGSQKELAYRNGLFEAQIARAEIDEEGERFIFEQVMRLRRQYGRVPPLDRSAGQTGFRLPKNARKRLHREYNAWIEKGNAERTPELPFAVADDRADALLRECLNPQQRLDLEAHGGFYVRGQINRLYFVDVGDGFDIVDPVSHVERASFCLHPEEWIPHADVALATKLAIDAGKESEAALLEAARPYPKIRRQNTTLEERAAAKLEQDYRLYP